MLSKNYLNLSNFDIMNILNHGKPWNFQKLIQAYQFFSLKKNAVKSKENHLKLCLDTSEAKLYVKRADEQAKRKLDLIRKIQELEEAET